MPLSDDDLKYTLSIEPDASRVNAAMDNLAKRADDIGKRVGEAMVRGMSGSGGEAAMQRRGPDPMAALTTGAEQDRLLKESLSAASPLLQRLTAYRESQEKKSAAARRSEFVGSLGRAAAGEAIGSVGGLGGIGAMVAGGVSAAGVVTGGLEIVKKPFELLASRAEHVARSFSALNSNIGAASQGFERSIYAWSKVPLIGEYMVRVKEAERQEAETKMGWARLYSPGAAYQMEMANLRRQATEAYIEEQKHPMANRVAAADVASGLRQRQATLTGLLDREREDLGFWGRLSGKAESAQAQARRKEKSVINRLLEEASSPEGLTQGRAAEIAREYERLTGQKLPTPINPALPAQITGIEDYLTNLYTQAASLGSQGKSEKDQAADRLTDAIRNLTEVLMGQGKDHAGNAVDRVSDAVLDAAMRVGQAAGAR